MNPISTALQAKGAGNLLRRSVAIGGRYGLTPAKMDQALAQYTTVLNQFGCSATFPITSVALQRASRVVSKYQAQGIEFAVHGFRHVDYSRLPQAEQARDLKRARKVFDENSIKSTGFRCPYLTWNSDTLTALSQQGYQYDSSQALAWDVMGHRMTDAYERVLDFCRARSAADYPALPELDGSLVRIPYCLPDDEAIVERLALGSPAEGSILWQAILQRTYDLGELFTLGLHPERIGLCWKPLADTLAMAKSLSPAIWIARLDAIATWWRTRTAAVIQVTTVDHDQFQIVVNGPPGVTILTRGVGVDAKTTRWSEDYWQVDGTACTVQSDRRPFIGVSPDSSHRLLSFLRQQGYLVEATTDARSYAVYIDQADLCDRAERVLLTRLTETDAPLVRLGRWPNGARSALAITGDIDALTLWDYGLRFLGR